MTIATKAVTGMAERLGCCTVVPHHTTKLGARSGESDQYTGSGSAAFGDNLRVILVLVTQTLDEMKETVALTPLQEAGLCMSQILKLTDTRGSLRRKTLEPIWIARNSFELRRVDGVLLSEGQRIELRMSSIADIVRAGHTSVAAIRGALKVSTAKANALVAQAIQRGFIVKGVRRGDPLTAP